MRPYDGQREVIDAIAQRLEHPSLTAEELGRALIVLERFANSGLIDRGEAVRLVADRVIGPRLEVR